MQASLFSAAAGFLHSSAFFFCCERLPSHQPEKQIANPNHNKSQKTMVQSAPPTFMGLIPQENFSIEVDLMIAAHRKIIIQIKAIYLKQCFRFQELGMDQKIKYLA